MLLVQFSPGEDADRTGEAAQPCVASFIGEPLKDGVVSWK